MKKLSLVLLGIVLLGAFAIFSREIKRGAMRDVDFAVTVKVQERIDTSSRLRFARLTGEVMEGATVLASPLASITVITVITIITVIRRKQLRLVAIIIPIAFSLMTMAEIYGKSVIHHPAPPFFLLKNPTTLFPKYYVWEDYSYPSGHAARATFLSLTFLSLLAYRLSPKKTLLKRVAIMVTAIVYVGIVSFSRIYLGHHWLSDVVGGWLIGSAFGLASVSVL